MPVLSKEKDVVFTIELRIETDEAEPAELALAVRNAVINGLLMPNTDTLYLNSEDVSILVKDVSA